MYKNIPYLSICCCFRNDNYGGDQLQRFQKFVDYYSHLNKKYKNIFEFVICDYNSPKGHTILDLDVDWHCLKPLQVVIVSEALHLKKSGGKGRVILDYLGRNIAIRHAQASFVAILNQDIFISDSIAKFIYDKKLSSVYFYRSDRWDFTFDGNLLGKPENVENYAQKTAVSLHRRHDLKRPPIDLKVVQGKEGELASIPLSGEKIDKANNIFYGKPPSWKNRIAQRINGQVDFEFLGLHTNASGDFIVAPKKAWEKIHGAFETTEFYMHLDSYLLAQMYGAGFCQAIFGYPHQVFHADHDRSARLSFKEKIPYEVHRKRMCDIALGVSTYRLNGPDWGMKNEKLDVIQL
jgi:hypothetical protein